MSNCVRVANCKVGDLCGINFPDDGDLYHGPYKVIKISKKSGRYKVQGNFIFALSNKPFWIGNLNCAKWDEIPMSRISCGV